MSTLRTNNLVRAGGTGVPDLGGVSAGKLLPAAWVNFNGTGTVAIRDSYNVASITDNGAGAYAANFGTLLDKVGYAVAAAVGSGSVSTDGAKALDVISYSTSAVSFYTRASGGAADMPFVNLVVFGGRT